MTFCFNPRFDLKHPLFSKTKLQARAQAFEPKLVSPLALPMMSACNRNDSKCKEIYLISLDRKFTPDLLEEETRRYKSRMRLGTESSKFLRARESLRATNVQSP